ncbi:P-loop containing nucleoside triphosphate hydrolase protein [Xylaria bambusicola]|uniref:P-loop containing nucleoside triphosphate hydrolase protein n=1 Tax=Xylaria bambusicola TaxID=326684 RepID=UPI002007A652|nr:P-loop containing nucleoside triphosphate hydrolase protein [Xylaria bambusicola]KAI0522298.1 P-loop containing nucleoside triphosphate hydrolase protein [Xylaria bambusicola]
MFTDMYNMISRLVFRVFNTSRETSSETRFEKTNENRPPLIIFILGAPGAGKGTHSKRLRRDFQPLMHLPYASIPASWVSTFPRRDGGVDGNPVLPTADAVQLLRETIESGVARGQNMWLIDGFPRSKAHMDPWVEAQMPQAVCALYLHCDSEVLVRRIRGRAESSGRPDDAKARERVERNISDSEEMLKACREADVPVVKINAHRDPDAVYSDISRHFEKFRDNWIKIGSPEE